MKCTICGKVSLNVIADEIRTGKAKIFHCDECDVGLLMPIFKDAKDYYDNEYRKKFADDLENPSSDPDALYNAQVYYQANRLNHISPYFDKSKTFLEIGCSAGQFLSHVTENFKACYGVEFDTKCSEYVRRKFGVEVRSSELKNADFSEEKFDYIAAFQVLEHTENPTEFLSQIRTRLNSHGKIFIEVPNLHDALRTCWNVPTYKTFYFHEAHTHYFSLKSLERLFSLSGFRIDSANFLQDYNLLNHLSWYFTGRPQPNGHFGLSAPKLDFSDATANAGRSINRLLEQTDQLYKSILAEHQISSNIFITASRE